MRGVGLLILLLTALLNAKAAPKPRLIFHTTKPTALSPPEPIFPKGLNTLVIPIKRAGNLIIIEAQVDSVAGNFVLDTGAPYLVLNATYFRNMPNYSDQEANGVNGNSAGTFRTEVKNFSLGLDLSFKRLTADVADLSAIENSKHIKILGLLGTQIFRKLAITVDHFHNVLYIHKLDSKGEIPAGERIFNNPEMTTPFKYMNDVIFLQGSINQKNLWFAFDTGAECNLLSADAPKNVMSVMKNINTSTVIGVGGAGKNQLVYANFKELFIGNYRFLNNRVLITNLDHLGRAYGNSMDAVLGYDFFARGIFTINFVKKEFEMYIYRH
ncbi:aspartyl protease family protein [Mucilaginibacter terrae]|uniref:aspartyl protease family protein n=1 Tax=Mucilaginibacter terrae TaxID=1955052 RepID=UPI0036444DA7